MVTTDLLHLIELRLSSATNDVKRALSLLEIKLPIGSAVWAKITPRQVKWSKATVIGHDVCCYVSGAYVSHYHVVVVKLDNAKPGRNRMAVRRLSLENVHVRDDES